MAANSLQRQISKYIYQRAPAYGVNPNTALGVAWREGLNSPTANLSGNRDAGGWSVGPFQLFSKPGGGGGLAAPFTAQFGAPNASNWQQQVDFSLGVMGKGGYGNWYAIRDAGGMGAITNIGAQKAAELGLSPGGVTIKDVTGDPVAQAGSGGNFLMFAPEQSGQSGLTSGALSPTPTENQPFDMKGVPAAQQPSSLIFAGLWEAEGVRAVTTAGKAESEATIKSGETIGKAATESAKTISEQQKASSVAETGTLAGIANAAFSNTFNLFQRFGVILLALLLIGIAFWLMGSSTVSAAKNKVMGALG